MSSTEPQPPTEEEWLGSNVSVTAEIHGGRQSRLYDTEVDGSRTAVKLTDMRLADVDVLTVRMELAEALARSNDEVLSPIRIDGSLVGHIGEWLMTATPFVEGDLLNESDPLDARRLGSALGRLHESMRDLEHFDVPTVAALAPSAPSENPVRWQVLHGDFSSANVIAAADGLKIFDFDDCGCGPIEYDIANSLYMVMFDAEINKQPEGYETFRPNFLAGYADSSNAEPTEVEIDEMIALRIDALGRWLDDLTSAPIGIRTSSPEWLDTLRSFVRSFS